MFCGLFDDIISRSNEPILWLQVLLDSRLYISLRSRGEEPSYYHVPHEFCIIAGRLKNQLIISFYHCPTTRKSDFS